MEQSAILLRSDKGKAVKGTGKINIYIDVLIVDDLIQYGQEASKLKKLDRCLDAIVKGRAKGTAQDAADISALFITAQDDTKADKPAADDHAIWSFIHLAELWNYLLLTHGAMDS